MGGEQVDARHVHRYHWEISLVLVVESLRAPSAPVATAPANCHAHPSREPPFFVRPNRRQWECQEQSRKEVGGIHKKKKDSRAALEQAAGSGRETSRPSTVRPALQTFVLRKSRHRLTTVPHGMTERDECNIEDLF
jgi:hypothetical protein